MKTTIIVEDGRVTVQVDDGQQVVVKPVDKGGVQIESPLAAEPVERVAEKPRPTVPEHKIAPSSTDLSNPLPTDDRCCSECGGPMTGRPATAKICDKPECKKSRTKRQNEEMRRRKGQNVGVGRGRGRKPEMALQLRRKDVDYNDEKMKSLTEDSPKPEPTYRSNCHDAAVKVSGGEDEPDEGGTRFYVCLACQSACDVHELPFDDPWNCGACRTLGWLCRLHQSLHESGKKPPVGKGIPA